MSIVPSIEDEPSISPGTIGGITGPGFQEVIGGKERMGSKEIKIEDASDEEEVKARVWDESQSWNGYVKHKESWVRRAGLKREREECERSGVAKRGRA